MLKLEIREQHWMGPLAGGRYDDGSGDACSHGSIYGEIAGQVVTSDEPEYGINQSALSLLRTLELDHPTDLQLTPMPGYLLGHGCGYPLGLGCDNFGTDWVVTHDGDEVILSDALLIDSRRTVRYDVKLRLPIRAYAEPILAFAHAARRFYWSDGPRRSDPAELDLHERFWAEYEARLKRAAMLVGH